MGKPILCNACRTRNRKMHSNLMGVLVHVQSPHNGGGAQWASPSYAMLHHPILQESSMRSAIAFLLLWWYLKT